ncbi:hypothetical protein LUZ61_021734 [Rhynchospora tenuis]|uniref:Maturase K n=1 Tax=Rhynchospora tenuis TaxID=198213 RepID=A0AAD5W6J6_9POAL|nr:hypothetical protein LUZ61_021734 [Rhynchospora tenuis]
MHYVRYQGKAILTSKGTDLFMEKWKSYLKPIQLLFIGLSWLFFKCKKKSFVVRSQILEDSVLIDTLIKRFDTIVPVILLIRSLSKASLCTVVGHPTSKPIWTDLSDYDIISRFGRIWKNLFHFYSGSSKKRILYRMKYILRLSCARTLARKHKSTVRTLLQSLSRRLLKNFL